MTGRGVLVVLATMVCAALLFLGSHPAEPPHPPGPPAPPPTKAVDEPSRIPQQALDAGDPPELPPELRPGAAAWAAMEAPVSADDIQAELLSDDVRYPVHDGFAHALAERQIRLRRAREAADAARAEP